MRVQYRTLPVQALTKGATNVLDLPRDYFVQRLVVDLQVNYNTGTSVTKSATVWDLVSEVRIHREGKRSDIPFKLTGQQIRKLTEYDTMKAPIYTDFSTTASLTNQLAEAFIPVDFRIDKWNDHDFSALIDSFNYSSFKLAMDLGTESTIGSGYTFNSINAYVSLVEVVPEVGDSALGVYNHVLTYLNYGSVQSEEEVDINTGSVLRRLVLQAPSGGVSYFRIELHGSKLLIPKTSFTAQQLVNYLEYSPYQLESDIAIIDFAEINGIKGSVDLRQAKQGDVKLFTTLSVSSTPITLVYDEIKD